MRAGAVALALLVAASSCAAPPAATAADWRSHDCDSALGSPADASDAPGFERGSWTTNFARHCVPLSEIVSGGPPPDGIPPLDEPRFVGAAAAAGWLDAREPVIVVAERSEARAYPLQILLWHEIANDTIAGRPIAVTYCPLCDAALVFDRRVGGRELTFGTTGLLRRSDLVMWDRQTRSWWQQATGEAIVGDLTSAKLERVPSTLLSFGEFRRAQPEGTVLSREAAADEARRKTGRDRPYGSNPYAGYDQADSAPLGHFWRDPIDRRLPPKARVAVATFAKPPAAYAIDGPGANVAVNDALGGISFALLRAGGVASALDADTTARGRELGQAAFYDRTLDGRTLTFRATSSGTFVDEETRSEWTVGGVALSGPLRGRRLRVLPHEVTFWFIWSVFRPETEVRVLSP